MNNTKPDTYKDFVCVDGLQRITSIQRFINNEIKVFNSATTAEQTIPTNAIV